MSPPKLLNAQQAGEQLGVPHTWMLRQAREGAVPHVRLGKYVRFDAEQLDRWWRARLEGPVRDEEGRRVA